jgi:hypothetical protein
MRDQAKEQAFQAALETARRLAALDNRIAGDFPAYVFSPEEWRDSSLLWQALCLLRERLVRVPAQLVPVVHRRALKHQVPTAPFGCSANNLGPRLWGYAFGDITSGASTVLVTTLAPLHHKPGTCF